MKRPGNLIDRARPGQAAGPARALRGEVHPAPVGSKVTPVSSEFSCCGPVAERKRETRHERSITPMSISSVEMSSHTNTSPGAVGGELVHPQQRGGARGQPVVEHAHALARDVVGVHAVVGRGGHVHGAPVAPDPLAALEGGAPAAPGGEWRCAARPGPAPRSSVTAPPGATVASSSRPGAQVGPAAGGEAVEAPVDQVLGEVHAPPARVHGGGLVLEHAHGGVAHRPAPAGGVALPHEPVLHLLAGQPGAPGGPASRSSSGTCRRGSGTRRPPCPRRSKRIAEAPPWSVSEFDTRIQPPSSSGNVADPSDASCQR